MELEKLKSIIDQCVDEVTEAIKFFIEKRPSTTTSNNRLNACSGKGFSKVNQSIVNAIKKAISTGAASDDIKILQDKQATLPGYFRPKKDWDIVVKKGDTVVCAIEMKSLPTSFGNNFNNRVEECLGSAYDLKIYCAKKNIPQPLTCYIMLIPDCVKTNSVPKNGTGSYLSKFKTLLSRIVEEKLYSQTNLITYKIPNEKTNNVSVETPEIIENASASTTDITDNNKTVIINLDATTPFKQFMHTLLTAILTPSV